MNKENVKRTSTNRDVKEAGNNAQKKRKTNRFGTPPRRSPPPSEIAERINSIGFQLTADDPGIYIAFARDADIHAALDVPPNILLPAGLTRQATAAQSAQLVRNWYFI